MNRRDRTIRIPHASSLEKTRAYDRPLVHTPSPNASRPDTSAPCLHDKPGKPSSRRTPAPTRSKKRRKPRGCGCLLFFLLLVIILTSAAGAFWFLSAHHKPTPITDLPAGEAQKEALRREQKNIYILLAGDDERTRDEPARSDTIIYTVLRPVDKKITMVSIPRDTLVSIPDYGEDKINAALSMGKMPLLIDTVKSLVKGPVDHHVLVNFETFKTVVDAIGGITIDVPERMLKPEEDIDLKPGRQHLNGREALAFVRWRDDGLGDIGRINRQKDFMKAVMKKCTHLWPWQAAHLAWVLHHDVKTDLSLLEMLTITAQMAGIGGGDLQYEQFELDPQYINGVSYVLLDNKNVNDVVERMRYGAPLNDLS